MDNSSNGRMIQSDEVLFDLIEHMEQEGEVGVSELAESVGRSKSTVHAHLTSLANRGYVVNTGGQYRLGLRFFDLGIHIRNNNRLYRFASPKLVELANESEENVRCVVEENGLGTFIAGASGKHAVSTDARLGTQTNLHCISGGKAILAHLPRHRVIEIVDRHGLPKRTEETITDMELLLEELETIRNQGFALNRGESIDGIHAIGAAITDDDGSIAGALSVSGAANRLTIERCCTEIADFLIATTNEIELELSYADAA